ncbi:MAG: hypothetical protein ABIH99_00340 [Candidatus Micrarchaeota archaeon]
MFMPANKNKKGQFFSYDALISVVIFLLAFSILIFYWTNIRAVSEDPREDMQKSALSLSDALLTPGNPSNWDSLAVNNEFLYQIGVANDSETNVINTTKMCKLVDFAATNYDATKNALQMPYNYYIAVEDAGGNVKSAACSSVPTELKAGVPIQPTNNPSNVVNIVRVVILDGQISRLHVQVYN